MSNTAEKLEYHEQMDNMIGLSAQAFANTVWDDPQKAIILHTFWSNFAHGKQGTERTIADLEMRRIEAILLKMTDINTGFYGSRASSYIDAVGEKSIDNSTSIEDILPEKEVVVDAETNLKPEDEAEQAEEKGGKKVSLFNGQDMGDKPNQVDLSKAAKNLIANGQEDNALALARQFFGTGNYTPKKGGAKATPWKENQIQSWVKSIKSGIKSKNTNTSSNEADKEFGTTKNTLEAETFAFNDFMERYLRLATAGSEDVIAAETLADKFFKDRHYTEDQIKIWKETIISNENPVELDHFAILGACGSDSTALVPHEQSFEDISEAIKEHMHEIQVTKPKLKDNVTLLDYLISSVGSDFYDALIHTSFENSNGAKYELYTELHFDDFIERVVTANFTELDSETTETLEDSDSSDSVEDTTATKEKTEENVEIGSIEEEQAKALQKAKEKSIIGTTIKNVTIAIIKNGGIVDDIIDNPNYEPFYGKEHKFQTKEALEAHVTENFKKWEVEWKNSLSSFPMREFQRAIDTGFFNEDSLENVIKEAKQFMVKPDGSILDLVDKKTDTNPTETVVKFKSIKILEDYIKNMYKNNKNAAAAADVQKDTKPEEKAEADKSSGEVTKSEPVITTGHVVKSTYLENTCNRLIKKGKPFSDLMKDRKISELVESGGTITGPEKDISVVYDLSAESLDQLRSDLQKYYDNVAAKRATSKTERKSIVDKVKAMTSSTKVEKTEDDKDEETKQEPETVVTNASSITSLNQIQTAGLELIKKGCTKYDLLMWGQEVLLNRQLDEQAENAIFTSAKTVETFIRGLFTDFFKEKDATAVTETEDLMTLVKDFILTAIKEEGATYISVCKKTNTYVTENKMDLKTGSILKLVRENAPELYQKHQEKINKNHEESIEKVFVPEKISESNPTVWDKIKGFKTLGEIYATAMEFCDAGDWQQALNMTTELIEQGNIEGAENWTNDMITEWFNRNILKKDVPEILEEQVEEVEPLDDNFQAMQNANGGKAFRNALVAILSTYKDTPELRSKIISAIRGGKANYAKKISKSKESVLQGKINAAKVLAKPVEK